MWLLTDARYLDASVDVLVDEGKIVTMTPAGHCEFPQDIERFVASGMVLLPGLIDAHTHLREPGYEYKEDINTGLSAAAHGGFGSIMCMANTKPVNDCAAVATFMISQARKTHPDGPDLYPVAGATLGLDGELLAPLAEMAEAGCVAVSNDGRPVRSAEIVRRIMEYASDLDLIFIDHCEDTDLAKGWKMNEGAMSGSLGVKGQPACGEAIQAARDVLLAQCLDLPVHIAHVSSRLTVDIIAWAKSRGVKVTAETCPHYLLLDDTSLDNYNTQAKVSPPLRTPDDRQALREAVKTGIIDILVTDHAPHAQHEKDDTLEAAPFGFIGLELALPLTWSLVREGILAEVDLHRLWSSRPGQIFNLPHNEFSPGDPADFILFDPHREWRVTRENLYSKSWNTPFYKQTITGQVMHHWHNGIRLF